MSPNAHTHVKIYFSFFVLFSVFNVDKIELAVSVCVCVLYVFVDASIFLVV